MGADRVLIEIMTQANIGGVTKAEKGMLGLGTSLVGVTVLFGALYEAGKQMVDISEEHAKAENNLAGAIADSGRVIRPTMEATKAYHKALAELAAAQKGTYIPATHLTQLQTMRLQDAEARVAATTGQARVNALRRLSELQVEYSGKVHGATTQVGNLAAAEKKVADARAKMGDTIKLAALNQAEVQAGLEKFMNTNRDFISNQNDVINGWAALIREGVRFKDLSPVMTTALHIQAAEGGTLADAVTKVQQAEIGRNKSLTTAVGLTLQAIKPSDTYAEKQKKIAANLAAVAKAYKDVKLTPLQIASDHLSTTWEKIAEKDGPGLATAVAKIADVLDTRVLPSMQTTIDQTNAIGDAVDALIAHPSWQNLERVLFGPPNDQTFGAGGALDKLLNFLSGGRVGKLQAANAAALAAGSGTSIPHPNPHAKPTAAQTKATKEAIRRHDRSQS
jgi:hypothetical protein